MDNYKPNSHKSKTEKKEVKKVVKGTVKTKKKGALSGLKNSIVSEDANNVGSYIVMDVIVPTIKKVIVDIVTDSIHMIFLGESSVKKGSSRGASSNYVSYRNYSDDRYRDRDRSYRSTRTMYSCDDIIFDTREDAEAVLEQLDDMIATYGQATVGDFYDSVGKSFNYTDNKYGWTNLRSARVMHTRDGWILDLPRVVVL